MAKRHSMKKSHSKKLFTRTAKAGHTHKKNFRANPMRGGIRL
jgi:hypothetical protein